VGYEKYGSDDRIPALIVSEISSNEFHKNWVSLIKKAYNIKRFYIPK